MEACYGSTRDPLTLRFRDPSLEHEFPAEMAAANGPQARVGATVAIGLWLIAAFIIPTVIEVDRGVVIVICLGMAGANLVGVIASPLEARDWSPSLISMATPPLSRNSGKPSSSTILARTAATTMNEMPRRRRLAAIPSSRAF